MYQFKIEPEHHEYLKIQCGDINAIEDFDEWKAAYDLKIDTLYNDIRPYIPKNAVTSLDIGSGLGGIDIMLYKHSTILPELLDGWDDDPVVIKRDKTFSNAEVAQDYLEKNGVTSYQLSSPDNFEPSYKDLIISYSAWCFHIHPDVYLEKVLQCCHEDTVLILKIRKDRGYEEILEQHFEKIETIRELTKANLITWRLKC